MPGGFLEQQDGERIGFLPGGAAGHPDADRVARIAFAEEFRQYALRHRLEDFGVTKKAGHGNQQIGKQRLHFFRMLAKIIQIGCEILRLRHLYAPFKAPHSKLDVFHEEMARINDVIRREFFANAMPYGDLIHEKAAKYDVDPALVAAVVETESRFKTNARSQVGARGLMQLMPKTGRWMGARNLYNADQNVDAGAKYLKYLNTRFDGNLTKTIAAYNAGEGNVRRYKGIPPFRETRSYVKKVMSRYEARKKQLENYKDEHPAAPVDEVALR